MKGQLHEPLKVNDDCSGINYSPRGHGRPAHSWFTSCIVARHTPEEVSYTVDSNLDDVRRAEERQKKDHPVSTSCQLLKVTEKRKNSFICRRTIVIVEVGSPVTSGSQLLKRMWILRPVSSAGATQ